MSVTNNNVKQVDLPVWEWLRFAPTSTTDASAVCSGGENNRFLYYYISHSFYRYDTISDCWQVLSPQFQYQPSYYQGGVCMKYSPYLGLRSNVLDATVNTLTIAGFRDNYLKGYKVQITDGKGVGQVRTITANNNVVLDQGVMTAITASYNFTDSSKRWRINQWVGYQVRFTFNGGFGQVRKVLANDATTIVFADYSGYAGYKGWDNSSLVQITNYTSPLAVNGHYVIEKSTVTVDQNWTITPDATSRFAILSGGLLVTYAHSSGGAYISMFHYDLLNDVWSQRTSPPLYMLSTGYMPGYSGFDIVDESIGNLKSGNVVSATSRFITTNQSLTAGRYANHLIRIVSGTGAGQERKILGNNSAANSVITVSVPFDTVPDNTSTFEIYNEFKAYMVTSQRSQLLQYYFEKDVWLTGDNHDDGVARSISMTDNAIRDSVPVVTGVRQTTSVTTLNATPTAGGTGYAVGDIFNITGGTTLAQGRVDAITTNGVVTSVSIMACGNGYTTGTGKATTNALGSGTGLTVNITAVGLTGRITTITQNSIKTGGSVTIKGCSEAAWNTTYTVVGTVYNGANIFEVVTTATADMVASTAHSATVLVDATRNWSTNEHAGKVISLYAGNGYVNMSWCQRKIISNTATTITFVSSTVTPSNSTYTKYVIQSNMAFGRDSQYKVPEKSSSGWATGGSSTTLIDSTKNWNLNQWAGYKVRIISGTGVDNQIGNLAITANDATTLTITTPGFTPDTTTQYQIMDTFGECTTSTSAATIYDTTKNWITNQWVGKQIRIMGGIANTYMYDTNITANTANTITFSSLNAVDLNCSYCILHIHTNQAGTGINWIYGGTVTDDKGRYLYSNRGSAAVAWSRYDIASGTWDFTVQNFPMIGEALGNGTMYAYGGKDIIYIQTGGRILAYNFVKGTTVPCGSFPYGMSTTIMGNRMEIVTTADGLRYLYVFRHSGQEIWRTLLHWED